LPLLRVDLLHPRTGHYQRLALPHLLQHRLRAVETIPELIVLRGRNVVVLIQRLRPVPIPLRALHLAGRIVNGGLGVQLFLRPRAIFQLRQARLRAVDVGVPRLQIRRQARPLVFHRRLRLHQLRFARSQARRLPFPLRRKLIVVQTGDHLPLFHRVALVHRALHQPPGGFERDGDLLQLDIPGDHEAGVRCFLHPAKRPDGRPGGRQNDDDDQNSLFHIVFIRSLSAPFEKSTNMSGNRSLTRRSRNQTKSPFNAETQRTRRKRRERISTRAPRLRGTSWTSVKSVWFSLRLSLRSLRLCVERASATRDPISRTVILTPRSCAPRPSPAPGRSCPRCSCRAPSSGCRAPAPGGSARRSLPPRWRLRPRTYGAPAPARSPPVPALPY